MLVAAVEVKKGTDGTVFARRLDRKPLTDADRQAACRLVDALPGITVADVLRVFPGARVLTPEEARALIAVEGLPQ